MKTLSRKLIQILILAGFVVLTNCGGGSGPTPEERVSKLLRSGTWKTTSSASTVILDNIDVKDDLFADLALQFTDNQINVIGSSPVWVLKDENDENTIRNYPWQFKAGSKATVLIRGEDNREITIVEITSSVFKFTMEWDETTYGGRTTSLPGTYEFTLTK